MTRPWTPDRTNADGSTTFTAKRACNGCGQRIGDVTDDEHNRIIAGLGLPDVRKECPSCGPTAPEPRCLPAQVFSGNARCIEGDCDHERADEDSLCDEVGKEVICSTHSEIGKDGEITRAEAWPCTQTPAVTA